MSQPVGTVTFAFHHPERNFGRPERGESQPEAQFAKQFVEVYKRRFDRIHSRSPKQSSLFVQELPVPRNGIADLLVISWRPEQVRASSTIQEMLEGEPVTRAFEFKLSDWRKGLMQAYRYTHFADASILVVPDGKLTLVRSHMELFRTLRIGLWAFNPKRQVLSAVYTPRPRNTRKNKSSELALRRALSAFIAQLDPETP